MVGLVIVLGGSLGAWICVWISLRDRKPSTRHLNRIRYQSSCMQGTAVLSLPVSRVTV